MSSSCRPSLRSWRRSPVNASGGDSFTPPNGWMTVPAPDSDRLSCANYSRIEWSVTVRNESVVLEEGPSTALRSSRAVPAPVLPPRRARAARRAWQERRVAGEVAAATRVTSSRTSADVPARSLARTRAVRSARPMRRRSALALVLAFAHVAPASAYDFLSDSYPEARLPRICCFEPLPDGFVAMLCGMYTRQWDALDHYRTEEGWEQRETARPLVQFRASDGWRWLEPVAPSTRCSSPRPGAASWFPASGTDQPSMPRGCPAALSAALPVLSQSDAERLRPGCSVTGPLPRCSTTGGRSGSLRTALPRVATSPRSASSATTGRKTGWCRSRTRCVASSQSAW